MHAYAHHKHSNASFSFFYVHWLSQEQLAIREVVDIDIVNDVVDVRACASYVFVAIVQTKHCTHCVYTIEREMCGLQSRMGPY